MRRAPLRRPGARGALVLLVLVLLPACERRPAFPLRTAAGERPNVLLVTVDTLRADHLGAYGYPLATTPALDRLAAAGVTCAQAVAVAPETAPAVAALLTGLYQHRNRVLYNRGKLPADVTTLAERLHLQGYATAGFVGNLLVDAEHGFAQGFDHFESFAAGARRAGAPVGAALGAVDDRGVDLAIAWLRGAPAAPWLLWLHLMDPHGPYVSAPPTWSGDLVYPMDWFGDDPPIPLGGGNFGLGVIPRYQQIADLDRLSQYVRRYDGEIRFTDAQLARLFAALGEGEAAARTLVVVTADHGESLTEHREYLQHGWFVYDTTLRVPLVFAWPGVLPAGRTIPDQVSGVDLVPTLMEIVGIDPAADAPDVATLDGMSVAAALLGGRVEPHPAFAVGARENHPFAIRHGGWKLIHTPAGRPPVPTARYPLTGFDTPERFELYDVAADPGETRDRSGDEPARLEDLKLRLGAFRETFRLSGRRW